jgi:integrase
MAIYPDKKNGKPTGSWVWERQAGGKKLRKRFADFADAVQAEKDYKAGKTPLGQVSASPAAADAQAAPGAPRTLSAALEALEGVLWVGLKTQAEQVERVRRVIRWTGDAPLAGVDQSWADRVYRQLAQRGSAGGLNRNLSALEPFLKAAQARGWLRTVPAWERPDENEGRIRVISPAEEQRLLAELRANRDDDVAWLVEVALDTGMRRGELLTVADRAGLRQAANGSWWFDLDQTKSGSPRSVPLTPRALAGIRALQLAGIPPVHTIRYAWDKAQEAMGLAGDQDFTLHACRHTTATRLLERGENTRVIQTWLGHKQLSTTERYAHVFDQRLEVAAAKLA